MSTQPFSSFPESPKFFTTEATEEHRGSEDMSTDRSVCATQATSLLDEPWKVTLIPAGAPMGEDPHAAKSLPWRVGDVTRLKDDSPKGMMEYIATHSTGWWREMAERALRDTEKAERMAREAGWQHGQYWALEVDADAKQKLLEAEEAKRVREEAERAKDEAEKQAFIQRQMELLKKAGKAPRCEYQYIDGRGCRAPQVRGERWCHGHAKMMSYRPEKLEVLPMEDEQAVMVNVYRVTNSLLAGRITEKTAALMLWSASIVAPGLKSRVKPKTLETQRNGGSGGKKHLPRIHADERGSDAIGKPKTFETRRNRVSGGKARHSGVTHDKSFKSGVETGRTPRSAEIARDRGGKPKTFETQRNRGNEEKRIYLGSTRIQAD